jgi:hypothetical protein
MIAGLLGAGPETLGDVLRRRDETRRIPERKIERENE